MPFCKLYNMEENIIQNWYRQLVLGNATIAV